MPSVPMTLDRLLTTSASLNDSATFRSDGAGDVTTARRGLGGRIVQFFTGSDKSATRTLERDLLNDMRTRFGDEVATRAFRMARPESRNPSPFNGSPAPKSNGSVALLTVGQLRDMDAYAKVLEREQRLDVAAQSAMRYAPEAPAFGKIATEANVPAGTLTANQKALYKDLLQLHVAATMQDPAIEKSITDKAAMRNQAVETLKQVVTLSDDAIRVQRQNLNASQRAGEHLARAFGKANDPVGLTEALVRLQVAGSADASVASFGRSGSGDASARGTDMVLARAMAGLSPSEARRLYERAMAPDGAGRALVFAAGVHSACVGDASHLDHLKLDRELSHGPAIELLKDMSVKVLTALAQRGGIEEARGTLDALLLQGEKAGLAMLNSRTPGRISNEAAREAGMTRGGRARDMLAGLGKATQVFARHQASQAEAVRQRSAVASQEHRAIMKETRGALSPQKLTETLGRLGLLPPGEPPSADALSAIRGLVLAQVSRAAEQRINAQGPSGAPVAAGLAAGFIEDALRTPQTGAHVRQMLTWSPDIQRTVAHLLEASGAGDVNQAIAGAEAFSDELSSKSQALQSRADDRIALADERKAASEEIDDLRAAPPPQGAAEAMQEELAALETLEVSLDRQIATLKAAGDVTVATKQAEIAGNKAAEMAERALAANSGNAEAVQGEEAQVEGRGEAQLAADAAARRSEVRQSALRTAVEKLNTAIVGTWTSTLPRNELEGLLIEVEMARQHLSEALASSSTAPASNPLERPFRTIENAAKASLGVVGGRGDFSGIPEIKAKLNRPDRAPAEALSNHPLSNGGTVSSQFWNDLDRSDISLKHEDGKSAPLLDATRLPQLAEDASNKEKVEYFKRVDQEKVAACEELHRFVGDAALAERVTQLVHQGVHAPFLDAAQEGKVDIRLPDGTPGFLGRPKIGNSAGSFAISKEGDGVIRVDAGYSVSSATYFFAQGNDHKLDSNHSHMHFNYSMRITSDAVTLIDPATFEYELLDRGAV